MLFSCPHWNETYSLTHCVFRGRSMTNSKNKAKGNNSKHQCSIQNENDKKNNVLPGTIAQTLCQSQEAQWWYSQWFPSPCHCSLADTESFHYGNMMKQPDKIEFLKAMVMRINALTKAEVWKLRKRSNIGKDKNLIFKQSGHFCKKTSQWDVP